MPHWFQDEITPARRRCHTGSRTHSKQIRSPRLGGTLKRGQVSAPFGLRSQSRVRDTFGGRVPRAACLPVSLGHPYIDGTGGQATSGTRPSVNTPPADSVTDPPVPFSPGGRLAIGTRSGVSLRGGRLAIGTWSGVSLWGRRRYNRGWFLGAVVGAAGR